jgi:uncharacterized protein YjbI with pentapeptide repeats
MERVLKKDGSLVTEFEGDLRAIEWDQINLDDADLSKRNLEGAYMANSCMRRANLQGTDLYWATLTGSDLSHADLRHACLRGAKLNGVSFRRADLSGAELNRNNLGTAAVISGSDLTGAKTAEANFEGAHWDDTTVFPEGFSPEAHGMVRIE